MSTQPREERTQRFGPKENSLPELHLVVSSRVDGQPTAPLEETLANLTLLFDRIARLTSRGRVFYDHPDEVGRYALAFAFIQLGEQAKHLGRTFMDAHPEPAYRKMAKQRDFLAHHFGSIEWDYLWRTAQQSVPASAAAHAVVERKVLERGGQCRLG